MFVSAVVMAFADFTLDMLRVSFGISIRQEPLFTHVVPIAVPAWLQETLARGMPLALGSEKACSEFIPYWHCVTSTTIKSPCMIERRWTTRDRYGNEVYLTQERWQHIVEDINHPELEDYEDYLLDTIQTGRRKQDTLNPQKYRYSRSFDDLPEDNTHIVAIVLFRFSEDEQGRPIPNNYIVTAYMKEIGY